MPDQTPKPPELSRAIYALNEPQPFTRWEAPDSATCKFLEIWSNRLRAVRLGRTLPEDWRPIETFRPTLSWFESMFGRLTSAHAFQHRSGVFGFPLYEPHLTRTLAAFLQPCNVGTACARQRARTFLVAIDKATAGELKLCEGVQRLTDCLPPKGDPIHVVDEKTFEKEARGRNPGKRLDWYLHWNLGADTYALAVECKFGKYQPGKTQLQIYEKLLKEEDVPFFRLVATTQPVNDNLRSGWDNLFWSKFCRVWETEIAEQGDTDEDFARFRWTFWKTALKGGSHGNR